MRFASLGSGSQGNGFVVESARSRILLDCGFGVCETVRRLQRLGLAPEDLSALLVTHEHADHLSGVAGFALKYGLPVWLTHGTAQFWGRRTVHPAATHIIDSHTRFHVGALEIQPFPVPHDAREPVQFVFGDGLHRLGILTDTGSVTAHVESMLNGLDALVLECNHERALLLDGPYPAHLKKRVGGAFGHLDNAQAAALLRKLDTRRLQHLVAAHISQRNNTPVLARRALSEALGCDPEWVCLANQDQGFDWLPLT
ncbi:MAG: MBL fold metallo-hydrolase [Burkholderiales bacterium]